MSKAERPNFNPKFRLEAAQIVLDKGYLICETADAMDTVGDEEVFLQPIINKHN
jgi:transposase-like protein